MAADFSKNGGIIREINVFYVVPRPVLPLSRDFCRIFLSKFVVSNTQN